MNVKICLLSAFTFSVSAFATIAHQKNRRNIQRYLELFISLVKQKKVAISRRQYFLKQLSGTVVPHHPIREGTLKGRAIAINIHSPQNLSSLTLSQIGSIQESFLKVNYKLEKVF